MWVKTIYNYLNLDANFIFYMSTKESILGVIHTAFSRNTTTMEIEKLFYFLQFGVFTFQNMTSSVTTRFLVF